MQRGDIWSAAEAWLRPAQHWGRSSRLRADQCDQQPYHCNTGVQVDAHKVRLQWPLLLI